MQICNDPQKRRICLENSKHALDKNFIAIFALAKRLPTLATLPLCIYNILKTCRALELLMIYGIIQVRDLGALKVLKVQGEINTNRYLKLGGHGLLSDSVIAIETNFNHLWNAVVCHVFLEPSHG